MCVAGDDYADDNGNPDGLDCRKSCALQQDSDSCSHTYQSRINLKPPSKDGDTYKMETLHIDVKTDKITELLFVAEICGQDNPVDLDFYSISSRAATNCRVLTGQGESNTLNISLIVSVLFLLIITIGLVITTLIFYKRKHQIEQMSI